MKKTMGMTERIWLLAMVFVLLFSVFAVTAGAQNAPADAAQNIAMQQPEPVVQDMPALNTMDQAHTVFLLAGVGILSIALLGFVLYKAV